MTDLTTDVLVVGGGLAGVAAACAAARSGRRVCLAERRTYPGAELTATLRPWLTDSQYRLLGELFALPSEYAAPAGAGWSIIPDRLKTGLEDCLLAAGVALLYAMRPIDLRFAGTRTHVAAVGKAGRLTIETSVVVDATERAALARLVCAATPTAAQRGARLWRTVELTGVDLAQVGNVTLPASLAADCQIHPGYLTELGHVLVAHALDWAPGPGPAWLNDAEQAARPVSAALCRWLKEHHPAFAGARLTATGHELAVPPLWQVAPDPQGRIFVAGACAEGANNGALDPASLAQFGATVGRLAAPASFQADRVLTLPTEHLTADVLVIGGGSSGAAAAIGAARSGCRTVLADMNPGPGGTGTHGGVDSYWFGRRGGFNAEVSRWVAEQQSWMDLQGAKWSTEAKQLAWLSGAGQAGVQSLFSTVLAEVRTDGEGRVTGALLAAVTRLIEVSARVTIDATGDGDAALAAGAPAVYGSDREGATMWYSMAPHLRPGMTKNNFTSTVDVGDPFDYTRAILSGRRRYPGHDHGPYIAPRESRHVLGAVRITLTDILTMRRWPDVINVHFSNHDIKGQNCSDWLRMGLIPPNLEVQIPYGALVPQQVDGLLVTGKAISATHDGLPPLRMQADLENLGYICGRAAAMCVRDGVVPRHLNVAGLQAELVSEGLLPPAALVPVPTAAPDLQALIDGLDDRELLFQYGEMEMDEVRRAPIPMVQVCTAGPAIVPLLRAALGAPAGRGRLQIARALAWYGDKAATPVLLAAIAPHLAGATLPRRTAPIRYTQASPDHGAMPELAYLLHTLAMVRDEAAIPVLDQVIDRMEPSREQLEEQLTGLFHYVDSVCDIAERLGDARCVPALRRLQCFPLFRDQVRTGPVEPDFFAERQAYLEILIARALARCGDRSGAATLVGYLSDSRRSLTRHACRELVAISGQALPAEPQPWEAWLERTVHLEPRPWLGGHEA